MAETLIKAIQEALHTLANLKDKVKLDDRDQARWDAKEELLKNSTAASKAMALVQPNKAIRVLRDTSAEMSADITAEQADAQLLLQMASRANQPASKKGLQVEDALDLCADDIEETDDFMPCVKRRLTGNYKQTDQLRTSVTMLAKLDSFSSTKSTQAGGGPTQAFVS